MRVLITGGAGFVGSTLARLFREQDSSSEVVAFDNLRRRGSELNLPLLRRWGVDFVHGDIRQASDLDDLGRNFDLVIEASAEPSVHAGTQGSPAYLLESNLQGSLNALEFCRRRGGAMIFLSTSRVYSIEPLRKIPLKEGRDRFELNLSTPPAGLSARGISEGFPTQSARSLYGATKLASELFVQEYAETFKLPLLVNRCGVIAGPGQFGRVDQGVFTLWVARHFFKLPLRYTGFGGRGLQVRDLLHPEDLFEALHRQVENLAGLRGQIFNLGGGNDGSVSLKELTRLCEEVVGQSVEISSDSSTAAVDIPYYVSDNQRLEQALSWKPRRRPRQIVEEIFGWIRENETQLRALFT